MGKLSPKPVGFELTDTLEALGRERLTWLQLRQRVGKTSFTSPEGKTIYGDSTLKAEYDASYFRLDVLLDTYHDRLTQQTLQENIVPVDLQPYPHAEEIPIKHTDDCFGREDYEGA